MDHLREGIHWMSVGQQDPLVEYRRRGQLLFDDMQLTLRHEVLRSIFYAEPIAQEELDRVIDTDLTRAARGSVSNANQIMATEREFDEADFVSSQAERELARKKAQTIKKRRKTERKRKTVAKRRKK